MNKKVIITRINIFNPELLLISFLNLELNFGKKRKREEKKESNKSLIDILRTFEKFLKAERKKNERAEEFSSQSGTSLAIIA